jgi:RNA polymerase sigma factor (sigma-70 family)
VCRVAACHVSRHNKLRLNNRQQYAAIRIGEVDDRADSQLLEAVRAGEVAAYGELYKRHVGAARNLARQLAHSVAERDDLVSEAFSKVLQTLRAGRGPESVFRPYLLTALRHTAYDKTRQDRKVELHADIANTVDPVLTSVSYKDTVMADEEKTLVAKAFEQLPDRWRLVLWQTEVEGRTPAEVGPSLELSANGVSALVCRARDGLRQAYLQAHLTNTGTKQCEPTINLLGAWTRCRLSDQRARVVEEHLGQCDPCRRLSLELSEINSSFRSNTPRSGRSPLCQDCVRHPV